MKKIILALGLGTVLLTACAPQTIVYEDKQRNVSDVEEIIEDKLEAENPRLDLEVNITEEQDKKKKKKSKTH